MNFATIQSLLDTQLALVTDLPALQTENTGYEPSTTTAWCRSTFLPSEPNPLTYSSSNATDELTGRYQVDLFYPLNKGQDSIRAMADLVVNQFYRGTELSGSGVVVRTLMSWPEVGRVSGKFYQIPVQVRWTSVQQG